MAELTMKIKADTSEVDRIAIGSRLYDMFKADYPWNKLYHEGNETCIKEKDINAMYQLVNNTDRCIQVHR